MVFEGLIFFTPLFSPEANVAIRAQRNSVVFREFEHPIILRDEDEQPYAGSHRRRRRPLNQKNTVVEKTVIFREKSGPCGLLRPCFVALSSLFPNQLHEGFNLLRNLSAVGTEVLLQANSAKHLDGDLALADLAKECALSASRFMRAFKRSFGVPVRRYLLYKRVERKVSLVALERLFTNSRVGSRIH
jgi:hypothetical protein